MFAVILNQLDPKFYRMAIAYEIKVPTHIRNGLKFNKIALYF